MLPTGNAGNAPDLFGFANLFRDVQLHIRQHERAKLHADLSRAADLDWFPTIYALCQWSNDALEAIPKPEFWHSEC
jgi:hypothetical protein